MLLVPKITVAHQHCPGRGVQFLERSVDCHGGFDHRNEMEPKENRRFRRLKSAIPCAVSWKDEISPAKVTNLSHGGALITHAEFMPDEGAQIVLMFQGGEEDIFFKAQTRESMENDRPASFGIEFRETRQAIESKMIRLVDTLFPDDSQE